MVYKLVLAAFLGGSTSVLAATCLQTSPSAKRQITLRWSLEARQISAVSIKVGGRTGSAVVSCAIAQPYLCRLDDDLAGFTLIPDGNRVTLKVVDGRLGLAPDDGGDLQIKRIVGPTTLSLLEPKDAAVCARVFGGEPTTLTFP